MPGQRGELLRLLALETDALSLYAVAHLAGERDSEVEEALRARLGTAGEELAQAILEWLEQARGPSLELLEEVLGAGSEPARVAAVMRWAPGLGARVDELLPGYLERAGGEIFRSVLLGALGRVEAPLPEALEARIVAYLDDEDARVRSNAAELLGARLEPTSRECLRPLLADPVPRVRAAAARGVFALDPDAVVASMEGDLGSGEPRRVLAALHVLGQVPGYPGAREKLLEHLRRGDAQVRLMAIRSLGSRADELSPDALAEAYLQETQPACRRALGELAGAGPRRSFCERLAAQLAGDEDPRVRAGAARGIGEGGSEAEEGLLLAGIEDEDGRVRAEAVESLGRIGGEAVTPILEHALSDASHRVAANAALALWERGGAGCLERLAGWLRGGDPDRARSAAFALGEIGSVEVVAPLLEVAERLREVGAEGTDARSLLKQIMKALTKVRSGPSGGAPGGVPVLR